MNGNNGNRSRQNRPVNKMERAPTRHQPERASRVRASVMAAAQAAPLRLPGPVRGTRKISRAKNAKNSNEKRAVYVVGSRKSNVRNNLSLKGLSFGKSSFSMKRFNPEKASQSYEPSAASSGFVPQSVRQAFQMRLNENVARQAAANQERLDIIAQHRRNGVKKAAVTRQAKKEAMLAAQAAAAAANADMREAQQVVIAQGQSAMGVSPNAERALVNAQRAAENADRAFRRALANNDNNNNGAASASSSSASAASGNNLSSMFGRL